MIDNSIPSFLLTSQASIVDVDRELRRRCERGELHRVRAGVFVDTAAWTPLDFDGRYRVAVHAASKKLMSASQFSHDSAVALWHLPRIGAWPKGVHVLVNPSNGGRSSGAVSRHPLGREPHPARINDAFVTSLVRTVVDYSRSTTFVRAVVAADAAMAAPEEHSFRLQNSVEPLTRSQMKECMSAWSPTSPGMARVRNVLAFADGDSGSAGESVSRVQFHLVGFPPPQLQVPFYDAEGFIGLVDFFWPELDLIGEFDGDVKYLGTKYRRGQIPEQVVLAEKKREDRLRRVVRSFVRWDWTVARDQKKLVARLAPHGLVARR